VFSSSLWGVTDWAQVDSKWIRTTLRLSVRDVSARLACTAECSVGWPAPEISSYMFTCFILLRTTLTKGALARVVVPVNNESEPKPNAKSKSPREPKEVVLAGTLKNLPLSHPRVCSTVFESCAILQAFLRLNATACP